MRKILLILVLGMIILGSSIVVYAGPLIEIDVTVKMISNNIQVGAVGWSGINLGETNWKVANQYLEVHYACIQEVGDPDDPNDDVWYDGWGLQICTDNMNEDANPQFTGVYPVEYAEWGMAGAPAGDFAAGVICADDTELRLPMCWRVMAPKRFMSPGEPGYDPNLDKNVNLQIHETEDHHLRRDVDENYNCWIWLKDKANDGWSDPGYIPWGGGMYIPNPSLKWQDGMLYATVVCPNGIQHAEMNYDGWWVGPLQGQDDGMYGVYIYLGADFSNGVAQTTYTTSTLTVELYHL